MDDHGHGRHAHGRAAGARSDRGGRSRQRAVHCDRHLCHGDAARARHAGVAVIRRGPARRVSSLAGPRRVPQRSPHHSHGAPPLLGQRSPRPVGHEPGRASPHASLSGRDRVEHAPVARVLRVPALPPGTWRGAADHGHADPRQPDEPRRELALDLWPPRRARAGCCGISLGDGAGACRHGGIALRRDSAPRKESPTWIDRHLDVDRDGTVAAAGGDRSARGRTTDPGSRCVRDGLGSGGADAAGVAGRAPDCAEHRGLYLHGPARSRVCRCGPRRTGDRPM